MAGGKAAAKRRHRRQARAASQRAADLREQGQLPAPATELSGNAFNPNTNSSANVLPRSFVFGARCGPAFAQLRDDFRNAMNPLTASRLQSRHGNSVKDFLHVSAQYGVTHFCVFSETDLGSYMRLARVPRGPTLAYKIHSYATCADVARIQKRPHAPGGAEFNHPPLVVLNGFPMDKEHDKLAATMWQTLFPAIKVQQVQLSECRRVILLSFDEQTRKIDFRQFLVNMAPVGVSRSIKRVVRSQVPAERLRKLEDIADFVLQNDNAFSSDSEIEDTDETRITLSQDYAAPGQGGVASKAAKSGTRQAVRLVELGPRMCMELMKVEEGLMEGSVMYHAYVKKTPEEITALEKKKKKQLQLKAMRTREQADNVKAKSDKKEAADRAAALGGAPVKSDLPSSDDDDAAWYEKETGEKLSERDRAALNASSAAAGKKRKFNPYTGKARSERKPATHVGGSGSGSKEGTQPLTRGKKEGSAKGPKRSRQ